MPVDTKHSSYDDNLTKWDRCRHVIEGEDKIKEEGKTYLPQPAGMSDDQYTKYKDRALFYNATGRTVDGLVGMVFRKEPEVKYPEGIEEYLQDVTLSSVPFSLFCRKQLRDVLSVGRSGILVDVQKEGTTNRRPYLSHYKAENIINWRTENIGGDRVLTLVVLYEGKSTQSASDEFATDQYEQYRVLTLDWADAEGNSLSNPRYHVRIYQATEANSAEKKQATFSIIKGGDIYPKYSNGNHLDFIPFVIINPTGLGTDVEKPPLLDLISVNLSHYKTSADLEWATFYAAHPQIYVAGARTNNNETLTVGGENVWMFDDPQTTVGVVGGEQKDFSQLENRLDHKQKLMATLGARLLEEQSRDAEAAETVRLRQTGEQSTINIMSGVTARGCQIALRWFVQWAGGKPEDVTVKFNTEFVDPKMDPAMLRELISAVQAGQMSLETFYTNLIRGGLTREGVDWETERADIQSGTSEETL